MKKMTHVLLLLTPILFATEAFATKANITAHVTRTLVTDGNTYGGCMAFLDKRIASTSLNCPSKWVSFSCDGTYNSKDFAYRKLDIAQKSEVTGHKAKFYIDDLKKHNGYCYAYRIDSYNTQ